MGQQLGKPVKSKIVTYASNSNYRTGTACMNGWRAKMEDEHSVALDGDSAFFAVFDGHGGDGTSKFCSDHFPDAAMKLLESAKESNFTNVTPEEYESMFLGIDARVLEKEGQAGSTATTAFVTKVGEEFEITVCNVGDSRTLLIRDGEMMEMTFDHHPNLEEEKARIEKYGGMVSEGRVNGNLAMSRAMGDGTFKTDKDRGPLEQLVIAQPDVKRAKAKAGDVILLFCDGIVESEFTNQQVVDYFMGKVEAAGGLKELDLGQAMCDLCDEALDRKSMDNMSAMAVVLGEGVECDKREMFLPGDFHGKESGFLAPYKAMCIKGGMEFPVALRLRHELLAQDIEKRVEDMRAAASAGTPTKDPRTEEMVQEIGAMRRFTDSTGTQRKYKKGMSEEEEKEYFENLAEYFERNAPSKQDNQNQRLMREIMASQMQSAEAERLGSPEKDSPKSKPKAGGKKNKKKK